MILSQFFVTFALHNFREVYHLLGPPGDLLGPPEELPRSSWDLLGSKEDLLGTSYDLTWSFYDLTWNFLGSPLLSLSEKINRHHGFVVTSSASLRAPLQSPPPGVPGAGSRGKRAARHEHRGPHGPPTGGSPRISKNFIGFHMIF